MPHAPIRAALLAALLMNACASPPASSEPQRPLLSVDQVAGYWALNEVGGGARCELALANLVIEGVRPVRAERCGLPIAAQARSWRATETGFELLGVDSAVILAFRRTGEDAFEEVAGRYRLTRAPLS
jgi:hypothetical protein